MGTVSHRRSQSRAALLVLIAWMSAQGIVSCGQTIDEPATSGVDASESGGSSGDGDGDGSGDGDDGISGDGDSSGGAFGDGDGSGGLMAGVGGGDAAGGITGAGGADASGGSAASGGADGSGGGACVVTPIENPLDMDRSPPVSQTLESCAVEAQPAQALPVDIILMIDQSISMVDHTIPEGTDGAATRWEILREAVLRFSRRAESEGVGVGLQFFPQPGSWQFPDGGSSGISCDASDYSQLVLPVAELPAASDSLEAVYPELPQGGFTPSLAALEGALAAARAWTDLPANAGRSAVVAWVTDGYPTVCDDTTIASLVEVAGAYDEPAGTESRVPTFVIGLGPVVHLTTVANAGGTGDGYFVADDECDPVGMLVAALGRVANSPNSCRFSLPEGLSEVGEVNLEFAPFLGAPMPIGQTTGPETCETNGGWYYVYEDQTPTSIEVCPQTCGTFGGGTVSVVTGCETVTAF